MMKYVSLCLVLLCLALQTRAQELFCTVSIDYNRVAQGDKMIFQDMQRAFSEYLNFQKWTEDEFAVNEKIRCNFRIIINERPTSDYFKGTANIQIFRPAFNSTYESVIVNLSDKAFNFKYVQSQPLQFVDNSYTDNLTALLNFYANIILGFDYATFGKNGGNNYFQKAMDWVNLSNASQEPGWTSNSTSQNNRYWLAENLTNRSYAAFQTVLYKYHRQGIDQMVENLPRSRRAVMEAAREMQRLNKQRPLLFITRIFLDAKDDEMIKIFNDAFVNDKKAFIEIMEDLDPSNLEKYQNIMK
jgi:hypothetical protein